MYKLISRERLMVLTAAGLGLFFARVVTEYLTLSPDPGISSGGLLLIGALAVTAIIVFALAWRRSQWLVPELLILWFYVLWPWADLRTAGLCAGLTLASMLISWKAPAWHRESYRLAPAEILLGLLSLGLYLATLAPGVLPADAGEFQLVAARLGIAHPPGYPLYTLVGALFAHLPAISPALGLNLLSALLAACTLVLVSMTIRKLGGDWAAGLAGALALAGAFTFWAQATTANIRMPTALFTILLIFMALRWKEAPSGRRLAVLAFTFGLAVTHHSSLVFLGLPLALFILGGPRQAWLQPRLWPGAIGAFLAAFLVWLYLPWRDAAGAPLAPGNLTTLDGFLGHVLALGFRGDAFAFAGGDNLPDRLRVLSDILRLELGWALLALVALGALAWLVRREFRYLILLGGCAVINAFVAITYRAPQTVEYLIPAYVALAVMAGTGAGFLANLARRSPIRPMLLAGGWALGCINLLQVAPSAWQAAHDQDATQYAVQALAVTPPGGLILANWHWATPLWFEQQVAGVRSDVQVRYVSPQGAEPIGDTWRRLATEAAGHQPVLLTNRFPGFTSDALQISPAGALWQAQRDGEIPLPGDVRPLNAVLDNRVVVLGATIEDKGISAGSTLRVAVYWRSQAPASQDTSFFVHLVEPGTGRVWGQSDITRSIVELSPGTAWVHVANLALLPDIPPGTYQLVTGAYSSNGSGSLTRLQTGTGEDHVVLGEIQVAARQQPYPWVNPLGWDFGSGPLGPNVILDGVAVDTTLPGQVRLWLGWRVPPNAPAQAQFDPGGARGLAALPAPGYQNQTLDLPAGMDRTHLQLSPSGDPNTPGETSWRQRGPWGLSWPWDRATLAVPQAGQFIVFGGEMALTGTQISPRAGEIVVDLHWLSLKPLNRDYTVSVQIHGSGWTAQHDGTPALGAIPTLKWITGTDIWDRHRVPLPPGSQGPGQVTVTVYDAFTLEPLVVLDDRLLKLGQGTALQVGEVTP